jgi:hypothetical protein
MTEKDEQPELPLQTDSPIQPEGELPEERKTQKSFLVNGTVDQTPPKKAAISNESVPSGMFVMRESGLPILIILVHPCCEGVSKRSERGE